MILLLDTNVIVLLVVGAVDRTLIGRHKRLGRYSGDDYDAALQFVSQARKLTFLPNVISEASNLAVIGLWGETRAKVLGALAAFVRRHEEDYVASRDAVDRPEYVRLGVTDAALLLASLSGATIFSDDAQLCIAASRVGVPAVTLDLVRTAI